MAKKIAAAVSALLLAAVLFALLYRKTENRVYEADTSAFPNALMGYAPAVTSADGQGATLRYLELSWRELEPERGQYAFEAIEQKYGLDSLRKAGIHLVLRFICDKPKQSGSADVPDWLYETGAGAWYANSYGEGWSPDYSDEFFRSAHAEAIAALGEHFGQDNFVSYVELGSLGHWGEWHVYDDGKISPMPSEEIRNEYVRQYIAAFPNARLLMRRPFNIAAEEGLGVYNDMTGASEDTEEWLDWLAEGGYYGEESGALSAIPDFWLKAPVGGEFTSSTDMGEMLSAELPRTLDLIERSHMTFIGPKTADTAYPEGYNEVLSRLGYRLRVSEAKLERGLLGAKLTLTVTNDGAAPFYWDWQMNAYAEIKTENGSVLQTAALPIKLSALAPSEEQTVTVALSAARLKLFAGEDDISVSVGIIDPLTSRDAVRLAQLSERDENGRTVLF